MVSKTKHQHRLSTCNGRIPPAGAYFSHAKNRPYHTAYTIFSVIIILFSFLFPARVQGSDNIRDLVTETTRLAQQGDAEAQFSLALMYDEGQTKRNLPAAALYLGMKYEFGNGVQQNKAVAEKWYEQAALQGWAMAQYLLAMLLLDESERSIENRINAGAWLKLAGKQEYPQANEKYLEIERTLSEHERALLSKRYEHYAGRVQ